MTRWQDLSGRPVITGHPRDAVSLGNGTFAPGTSIVGQPGPYSGGANNLSVGQPLISTAMSASTIDFSSNTHTFSLETFLKILQPVGGTAGNFQMFTWTRNGSTASLAFGFLYPVTDPVSLATQISSSFTNIILNCLSLNTWHHFVARTNSDINHHDIFIDGVQVGTNIFLNGYGSGETKIGANFGAQFNGNLAGFAVYDHALSNGEIAAHYAARTTNADYQAAVLASNPSGLWMLDIPYTLPAPPGGIVTIDGAPGNGAVQQGGFSGGWTPGQIAMGNNAQSITLSANASLHPFHNSTYGVLFDSVTHVAQLYQVVADASTPTGYAVKMLDSSLTIPAAAAAQFPSGADQGYRGICLDNAIVWVEVEGSHAQFELTYFSNYLHVLSLVNGQLEYSGPQLPTWSLVSWTAVFDSRGGGFLVRTGTNTFVFIYGDDPPLDTSGLGGSFFTNNTATFIGCQIPDGSSIITTTDLTSLGSGQGPNLGGFTTSGGAYVGTVTISDGSGHLIGCGSTGGITGGPVEAMYGIGYTPGVGANAATGYGASPLPIFSNEVPIPIEDSPNFVVRPITSPGHQYAGFSTGSSFTFNTTAVDPYFPIGTLGSAEYFYNPSNYLVAGLRTNPTRLSYSLTFQSGTTMSAVTHDTPVTPTNPYYASYTGTWQMFTPVVRHGSFLAAAIIASGTSPNQKFFPVAWSLTGATAPGPLISYDSFNRNDNLTNMGITDGNGSRDPALWVQGFAGTGDMGIKNNGAGRFNGGTTRALVTCDLGTADVDITVTRPQMTGGFDGIVFRYVQANPGQYWFFGESAGFYFLGKINGTTSDGNSSISSAHLGCGNGDVIRVVATGNSITCYVNGVQLGTIATDSYLNTATKHGFTDFGSGGTTPPFDDWTVRVP